MVDISLEVFSIEMAKLVSVMVLKLLNIFYGMMWFIMVSEVMLTVDVLVSLTWIMMLTMVIIDVVPMLIVVMLIIVDMMAIVMILPSC